MSFVVNAVLKLENLKAIHNHRAGHVAGQGVVNAVLKLENLKAIHNAISAMADEASVVKAVLKLENLKAIPGYALGMEVAEPFGLAQRG